MERVDEISKETLDKALAEHGFFQTNDTDNIYSLVRDNDPGRITAQIILPEPGNESTFGIRGIQAIGNFHYKTPPPGVSEPSFCIFTFMNSYDNCIEFIIIRSPELKKRLKYRNSINSDDQKVEIVFWLMEDKSLYDATGLGAEGRYCYIDGRMDNSTRCFTEFLNFWKF